MKAILYKWRWVLILLAFSIGLYFMESIEIKDVQPLKSSELIEISDSIFYQNLYATTDTYCVFFYTDESRLCNKMEENIDKVKKENFEQLPIYKINIEDYPYIFNNMNLSELPVMILYKNGKESKRIMGKTSTNNLNLILERIIK